MGWIWGKKRSEQNRKNCAVSQAKRSKLSWDDVTLIRKLKSLGCSHRFVAWVFDVDQSTISRIMNKKTRTIA